ncbi:MAG: hypothetical protein QM523_01115 [Candidatus Pacebacteria bacterium]|nr:hypothetical protein [Candidatus Paceibacterota bacterium]
MNWAVALKAVIGALLGPLAALVREMRARAAGKREARQEDQILTRDAVIKAKDARDEIENEIAADPDLVAHATRAGLVRGVKPDPVTKPYPRPKH